MYIYIYYSYYTLHITLTNIHAHPQTERPFFGGLVDFITSGPVVAMVWEGKGVIASARTLIGATNPLTSAPGTIRGDLAVDVGRNIVHGSDGEESAAREIALWFKEDELAEFTRDSDKWLYE